MINLPTDTTGCSPLGLLTLLIIGYNRFSSYFINILLKIGLLKDLLTAIIYQGLVSLSKANKEFSQDKHGSKSEQAYLGTNRASQRPRDYALTWMVIS